MLQCWFLMQKITMGPRRTPNALVALQQLYVHPRRWTPCDPFLKALSSIWLVLQYWFLMGNTILGPQRTLKILVGLQQLCIHHRWWTIIICLTTQNLINLIIWLIWFQFMTPVFCAGVVVVVCPSSHWWRPHQAGMRQYTYSIIIKGQPSSQGSFWFCVVSLLSLFIVILAVSNQWDCHLEHAKGDRWPLGPCLWLYTHAELKLKK